MPQIVRDDPEAFDSMPGTVVAALFHWRTILTLLGLTAALSVSSFFAAESVGDALFGAGMGFSIGLLVATIDNAVSGGDSE